MDNPTLTRSKSDPPPITVEDTATGEPPVPSPAPEDMNPPPRAYTEYQRPTYERSTSHASLRERRPKHQGHRRKHSPNIEWKETWTQDTWKNGRVLLIDYVDRAHSTQGRRKIVAQEFCDIDSLRRFYRKEDLSAQAALRVIHVQNASWATRFLLRKFNIDASDDLVGTTFGRWARYERPQQRGGKPVLNGKTFRTQRDPWRGISRTAFGCDYLKHYKRQTVNVPGVRPMFELNHYDELDQPCYGFDVYVQRLSVYVQLSDGNPGQAVDPDIPNPYDEEAWEEYQRLKKSYGNVEANEQQEKYIPKLRTLDNGNTIIIFENSQSGSVRDTLIGARQELESRWRRLTFYLPREEMENDETMATECMDFIIKDIFKAVAYNWDRFVAACETHVGILEDKIYDNPADESRANELWSNSAQWLKVERLLYIHADIVKEMRSYLHELASSDPKDDEPWLGSVPDELEKLTGQWDRDIIAPTNGLSDLMYKSVGIRDARHSLQLGLSMWRLSWITFIFLPLTFTVGFFGMNVDTFSKDENNPALKWWFIVSIPILLSVLILWYAVKHNLSTQRQNPLRRGVYEALYHELATKHSGLWTRRGPRPGIVPIGWWNGLKWRLVTGWFGADKLAVKGGGDPSIEEFGAWSRTKQYLVRRWLGEMAVMPTPAVPLMEMGPVGNDENTLGDEEWYASAGAGAAVGNGHAGTGAATTTTTAATATRDPKAQRFGHHKPDHDYTAVDELISIATPVAIAELDPTAASRLSRSDFRRDRSLSPDGVGSDGRPGSSGGSSGVMVEEKGGSEDERSGDEGGRGGNSRRTSREGVGRLSVPGSSQRVR